MDPSDSTTSLSVLKEMKPVCKLLQATVTIKMALEENGDFEVDTFSDAESALFAFTWPL